LLHAYVGVQPLWASFDARPRPYEVGAFLGNHDARGVYSFSHLFGIRSQYSCYSVIRVRVALDILTDKETSFSLSVAVYPAKQRLAPAASRPAVTSVVALLPLPGRGETYPRSCQCTWSSQLRMASVEALRHDQTELVFRSGMNLLRDA
jgi:hypothetical protein